LGWEAAWFSEIEPFPCAVLKHHYPAVPNHGDMTKFEEWPNESIDLLVGGTPCQSFSVAGLRKGLADPRGNLMLTFLAIAQRHRPQWIVWENVPGVLSSNGGRDFGTFLGALGELGYGFAYRVLDAQWFGVAQRRRRVFVVGYFGDWQRPAKVLFESESVRRDSPPSREAGQETAQRLTAGVGKRYDPETETLPVGFGAQMSNPQTDIDLMQTLNAKNPMAVAFAQNQLGEVRVGEVTNTLNTNSNASGRNTPMVAQPVTQFGEIAGSLTARHDSSPCADRGQNVVAQPVAWDKELNARENLAGAMLRGGDGGRHDGVMTPAMQVRRLTPVECERLQGFPDQYTNIPWRKKPESPDGPRYKALGNSMAVPVMNWIGQRIQKVSEL
jgi:DNA (cytosine-5)-methyltransferase 1